MCTKGMPVESPGPGVADSCIMGAGEETKILCRSPSVLNRWAISPALCIAGFVDLCPRVPVLGTKTSDMLFLMELWSSVLHRYSTNGEVDLAVLCPAWKLKLLRSSDCRPGSLSLLTQDRRPPPTFRLHPEVGVNSPTVEKNFQSLIWAPAQTSSQTSWKLLNALRQQIPLLLSGGE